PAPFAAA
nr:Chain B, inhibitor peptide